jgi:transcriptional regulator with XRE-family HTH domain
MTRWNRFYEKQMEDQEVRALVEEELEVLRIGAKIAALREEEGLTQTKLAARAGMPSSKISAIENSPHNLEIATLVRIARAANRELQISFTPARPVRAAKRDWKRKLGPTRAVAHPETGKSRPLASLRMTK